MTRNKQLRDILEPEPPRLSPDAAARLDAAVDEALSRGKRRPWSSPRIALVAAPALLAILFAILWLRPANESADFWLLNEEQFVTVLSNWEDQEEALAALYTTDLDEYDDTENWTDSDWEAFQQDLEGFQLADNGGTQ